MNANKREYQIQIFIRVHWRLFAVLLVRLYPIEIDFDDSKWWCSPRSVSEALLPSPSPQKFGVSLVLVKCVLGRIFGERGASDGELLFAFSF